MAKRAVNEEVAASLATISAKEKKELSAIMFFLMPEEILFSAH